MTEDRSEELVPALRSFALAEGRGDVERLARDIMAVGRTTPIVCLKSDPGGGYLNLDPVAIRDVVGPDVKVWLVPAGRRTIDLGALLPPTFGVADGDVRIYWPCLAAESDPDDHPTLTGGRRPHDDAALQRLREAWARGPKHSGRAAHAWRLLMTESDFDTPTVKDLSAYRYALVEQHQQTDESSVSGHDSPEDACAYAGGQVLEGWEPYSIVDLDTGEEVVDRDGFVVNAIVTLKQASPDSKQPSAVTNESHG